MSDARGNEVFHQLARRLKVNVARGFPDQAESVLSVPARGYADDAQYQREIEQIFERVPLLVALTCDVPEQGDFVTHTILGRPLLIIRGDDGRARVFINACRHRGAALTEEPFGRKRLFTCPYHAWSYDRQGCLKGVPDRETFGDLGGIEGLIELPSDELAGAVFASLDVNSTFTARAWLGDELVRSLEALRLGSMYPYRTTSTISSPNWKLAADGYLDGYHIGLLHRNTIGVRAINNRNTYDLFDPHVRIGFAGKSIGQVDTRVEAEWELGEMMSLVHYIFPNVSISGGHKDTVQLSRLLPGPGVAESTAVQHHYFYEPMSDAMLARAEEKRQVYEQVVRDEDCATIFTINNGLPSVQQGHFVFGRNEPGNQAFHRTVQAMTGAPE